MIKEKKKVPQTRTSVWFYEEDLRARLPVLFEGTKYIKSHSTGKMCSFTSDVFFFFHGLNNDDTIKNK
jgi:hypothetical protein